MPRLLIVDDDPATCRFMAELLKAPERDITTVTDAEQALALAAGAPFDLVVSDINLNAARSGIDILKAFRDANPQGQVLLVSGFGTLDTALEAVRAGAFDYISKPFNIAEVTATVERALRSREREEPAPPGDVRAPELEGRSPDMLAVYKQIAHAAGSDVPVLILGESGVGKELVAQAIHAHSARAGRPLVAVNCAAIAETLLESELFGHVRGAFTGADADRKGIFEQAQGGTVLLDEVGETSAALQVKLLRVLETGDVRAVGASRSTHVDCRVIAATNIDLEQAVADHRFRSDLYYRIGVVVIRVPPLRERHGDVALLANRFLRNACVRLRRQVVLTDRAMEALAAYSWPGNVRELENTVERLVLFSRGAVIELEDLPPAVLKPRKPEADDVFRDLPTLEEMERRYLLHVLRALKGSRTRAAEVMGIDRRTLYRMAERYGINLQDELSDAPAPAASDDSPRQSGPTRPPGSAGA